MKPYFSSLPRPALCSRLSTAIAALLALGIPLVGTAADPEPKPPVEPAATDSQAKPDAQAPADDAKEEATPEEPVAVDAAPGDFRNWFNVSVGGLIVDGDKNAARQRLGLPTSAFGGVEDFHFEKDVGKKGLFKIDGRSLFDNGDYRVRLDYTETDKGFVRGGFSQSREYYDGSGGWFPRNGQWIQLYDEDFALRTGNAFFEAGLRLPAKPEFTVRYDHDYREGLKDSTIWGDTALTGGSGVRALVPSFWEIDERRDTVSFDLRHTLGKTTFGGAFAYEWFDLDNARQIHRRPGESSDRYVTQTERVERDMLSTRVFVDTILNERLRLTSAYLFTTLEMDASGSRVVGSDYDPVYDPINGRRDVGFLGMVATSDLDQHVWTVNSLWNPFPTLAVIPAFRIEHQSLDGTSDWLDTGAAEIAREAQNARDMLDLSQQLELRYTGITNIVLYARGDWVQGDGNLLEHQSLAPTLNPELHRDTDFDRTSQKYTAGAHWYPLSRLNLHAQYYRKMRESDYDLDTASYLNVNGVYPGFITGHDFTTDDFNVRVTWRPVDKLTLISRYDLQLNTIDLAGRGLGSSESGENTAHIFSQTVTWTPGSRFYLQPGLNYVIDRTKSGATSAVTPGSPVEESQNDYYHVNLTTGFVLDDRTDLQATYSYYRADNFSDVSQFSQPYGADAEEHGIVASIVRRISPKLRVTLKYGYFSGSSALYGGQNDYDAHLLYTSAQYLF